MDSKLRWWFALLMLLVIGSDAEAVVVLPKAGRYRGTVTIEFATADKKSSVKQIMPIAGLLLDNGTLQLVMPQIPDLPFWKTRQPSGFVEVVGAPPMIPLRLRWTATVGDVALTFNGPSTASAFTLAYDSDPAEPGSSHLAIGTMTIKMTRVGALP